MSPGFGNLFTYISTNPQYTTKGSQQTRNTNITLKNNFKTFFFDLLKTDSADGVLLAPDTAFFLNHTTRTMLKYMKNIMASGSRNEKTATNIRKPNPVCELYGTVVQYPKFPPGMLITSTRKTVGRKMMMEYSQATDTILPGRRTKLCFVKGLTRAK